MSADVIEVVDAKAGEALVKRQQQAFDEDIVVIEAAGGKTFEGVEIDDNDDVRSCIDER